MIIGYKLFLLIERLLDDNLDHFGSQLLLGTKDRTHERIKSYSISSQLRVEINAIKLSGYDPFVYRLLK